MRITTIILQDNRLYLQSEHAQLAIMLFEVEQITSLQQCQKDYETTLRNQHGDRETLLNISTRLTAFLAAKSWLSQLWGAMLPPWTVEFQVGRWDKSDAWLQHCF